MTIRLGGSGVADGVKVGPGVLVRVGDGVGVAVARLGQPTLAIIQLMASLMRMRGVTLELRLSVTEAPVALSAFSI